MRTNFAVPWALLPRRARWNQENTTSQSTCHSSHCLKLRALPFVEVDKVSFFPPIRNVVATGVPPTGACSLIMEGNADIFCAIFNLESVDVSACRTRPKQKHWHEYPGSAG